MRNTLRAISCLAWLFGADALYAECPVASDLESGIRVGFLDNSFSVFDRHEDAIRERRYDHTGALDKVFTLYDGIIATRYVGVTNGIGGLQSDMSYSFDMSELVPVETGKHVGGQISIKSNFGDAEYAFSFAVGEEEAFEIGSCELKNLPITEFLRFPEGITTIEYVYLQDLGFRVLLKDSGEYAPIVYSPANISALKE